MNQARTALPSLGVVGEEQTMGHAIHFLERLERLAPQDVELALGLYRDPPLVKAVLARAELPEGAERVAIAIGRGEDGPWLVVGRSGAFITCLGAGMKHDLPVVRRAKLDAIASLETRLRECMRASRELSGDDRPSVKFIAEAFGSGRRLSRERFLAIESLGPLLRGSYLRAGFDNALALGRLTQSLARIERFGSRHADDLAKRERLAWRTAHLWVAGADAIPPLVQQVPEIAPKIWSALTFLLASGYLGPAYRALWVAARIGPSLLRTLKERDARPQSISDRIFVPNALASVGVAHKRYRAEVEKALERTPSWMNTLDAERRALLLTSRPVLIRILRNEEEALTRPQEMVYLVESLGVTADKVGPALFEQLVQAMTVNGMHVMNPTKTAAELMVATGWAVRLPAADLNLPEIVASRIPKHVTSFEEHVAAIEGTRAVVPLGNLKPQASAGEGRNAPCPCGSGKKRKRCCGETAAA